MAEVVHNFCPRLVELHNYRSATFTSASEHLRHSVRPWSCTVICWPISGDDSVPGLLQRGQWDGTEIVQLVDAQHAGLQTPGLRCRPARVRGDANLSHAFPTAKRAGTNRDHLAVPGAVGCWHLRAYLLHTRHHCSNCLSGDTRGSAARTSPKRRPSCINQAVANCEPGAVERVLKLARERLARLAGRRDGSAAPSSAGVR